MFYSFIRVVARFIVFVLNGNAHYENKDKLPKGNYILVAPHRAWFDMIYFALAAAPKKFCFMAKKELFKNPILKFILVHANAFPVDRESPGASAIKKPVKLLKSADLSLIIFPSGTRHSQNLKGGAVLISKLSGVPLVPVVYQGPVTFKDLCKRQKLTVRFGDPIEVDRKMKLTDENQAEILEKMNQAFDKLDKEIDPNYHYVDPHPKK